MELLQVRLDHGRRIPLRITRDEDRTQDRARAAAVAFAFQDIVDAGPDEGGRGLLVDQVDHLGHLVQLLGADVRTVREAKVDLFENHGSGTPLARGIPREAVKDSR